MQDSVNNLNDKQGQIELHESVHVKILSVKLGISKSNCLDLPCSQQSKCFECCLSLLLTY